MATPDSIAHYLLRDVKRAVREFALIEAGDRIAVGVSGGKDSRTLLELLARGVELPGGGSYEVVAVHVETASAGLPDQRPALEAWFQALGVPYAIAPLELPADERLPLECFRCTRLRRKALFRAAIGLGCQKVAFGHDADDAAVTTLLSLLYKGQVEGLAPRREFFAGQLTVIRPLIYVTEAEIKRYARARGWDFPPELECPRQADARRDKVAAFLASFRPREREQIRANLWRLSGGNEESQQDGTQ
ncbi:MAG TPA: ATP-binding protein [Anaerolineae bacterium]|nr:ATP-binding protein [Anaerolineae bacterium]